jgi:hypothetical protein
MDKRLIDAWGAHHELDATILKIPFASPGRPGRDRICRRYARAIWADGDVPHVG